MCRLPGPDPQARDPVRRLEIPCPAENEVCGRSYALGMLGLILNFFACPVVPDEVHLVVLHTNDVHGQLLSRPATWLQREGATSGGLLRLAAKVAEVRERVEASGGFVLVLDGGDWFQGTPEGAVDGGRPFVRLLAEVGYDAMAIGNHEFDLGVEHAAELIKSMGALAVCANVREAEERADDLPPRVDWAPAFRVFERGGINIAVVGMVAPETPYITHKSAREGLRFEQPATELERVLAELPDEIQLVIPLTHCGVEEDRILADAFPSLPLIVGGHSHSFLRSGVRSGETLIAQAGSKASALGRVDLHLDGDTGEVLRASARLIDLYEEPEPSLLAPGLVDRVEALALAGEEAMGVAVGELLDAGPESGPFRSMPIGNWMADVMRRATGADVGVHNRGGIRKRLVVGPLTRRDLFEVMPFDNTVVSFELSGAELLEMMGSATDGRTQVRLEVSGMLVELEIREGRASFRNVWIDGRPVDPKGTYRLATNSFLAEGGDGVFRSLSEQRELDLLDTGTFVREAMEHDLSVRPQLHLPVENRFVKR